MPTAPVSFNDDQYLSSGQAARRLELSEARVRQLLSSGALPSIPTPLGRLIPSQAVTDLADRRASRKVRP
jgi:hypothetical protein